MDPSSQATNMMAWNPSPCSNFGLKAMGQVDIARLRAAARRGIIFAMAWPATRSRLTALTALRWRLGKRHQISNGKGPLFEFYAIGNIFTSITMNPEPPFSEVLVPCRNALLQHPLYTELRTLRHLGIFMEHHVFAVWDFMSLLKALQRCLTCVDVPWTPQGDPRFRRMINEMVLGEESDLDPNGNAVSHFELYLAAMRQAGADPGPVETLLVELGRGRGIEDALETARCPLGAREFVRHTFEVIGMGKPHVIAAAFTYGREDLIPDLFGQFVARLDAGFPGHLSTFRYYLERHIQLDGDEHGEMGRQLVKGLCGGDPRREREAREAAIAALEARLRLWDAILPQLIEPPGQP